MQENCMFIRENADKPKERKLPMIPLSEDNHR